MPKIVVTAASIYLAAIVAIAVQYLVGPEQFGWAGIHMFLPQWLLLIPGFLLLPLVLWLARRWTWMPLAALAIVAGPLMGFCWTTKQHSDIDTFRVMTYNVQLWQRRNVPAILAEIRGANANILILQDARGARDGPVGALLKRWNVAQAGQYVVASTFPIVDSTVGDISYDRQTHTYLRTQVDIGGRIVTVFNAHFTTPREALNVLRTPSVWRSDRAVITTNLAQRMTQAQALARDARTVQGPLIIAGDFNAPPQSLTSRLIERAGLTDAFAAAGRGYGYTFGHTLLERPFIRIDRIFVSPHLTPVLTTVGGTAGSDHAPVVADLGFSRDRD